MRRPFWSVIVPTYQPALPYLEQALRSVLAQDVGPDDMQIAIVDDGSDGFDPQVFLRDMGVGDRVQHYQAPQHAGIGANWNLALAKSIGVWVHLLHQDDQVIPGFYRRLEAGMREAAHVGAACTRAVMVDERLGKERTRGPRQAHRGMLEDWVENVVSDLRIIATAMVVKREVYETLGGFDTTYRYALDWDMWKRIAASYPIWNEPEALILHREHDLSTTRGLLHDGENMREIQRSITHSAAVLGDRLGTAVTDRARRTYARFGVDTGLKLLRYNRDPIGAVHQLREACRLTSTAFVLRCLLRYMVPGRDEGRRVPDES